jgi:hypothetical protein
MSQAGSRRALLGAEAGALPRSRPRLAGRVARLRAALVVAILTLVDPRLGAATAPPEHEVKAEFIERFTHFIDWPDSAFASPSAPFVVCAWGQSPLSSQLERVLSRGRLKARPVRLLQVESWDRLQPCHILYVATRDRAAIRGIVASTRGKPLLSVGDQPGFAEEGLLINLFLDAEGFVRFEINLEATRLSGLKVSAKLIRLARLVGTRK